MEVAHIRQHQVGRRATLRALVVATAWAGALCAPVSARFAAEDLLPAPNSSGTGRDPVISATFSDLVDPAWVTPESFVVRGGRRGPIDGYWTFSADGRTVLFQPFTDPGDAFEAGELVEVTLTTALRSLAGEPLEQPVSWHFRTRDRGGDATFSRSQALFCGYGVVAVEAGHLDGDGLIDLVAVRLNGEVQLYRNTTPPGAAHLSFVSRSYYPGTGYSSVLVRDLTGDGKVDIVVTDQDANLVYIGTNSGDGWTFTWSSFATCDHPQRVAAGDINGDGLEDLAYPCQYASQMQVRLAIEPGLYGPPATYAVGDWPIDLAIRDLDLDGDLDMVISNELSEEISVLRNEDPFALPEEIFTVLPAVPIAMAKGIMVEDLDGDRLPDLVVATEADARIAVMMMQGGCQLGPPVFYASGGALGDKLRGVVSLDLEGDGDFDLAVTNADADEWLLLEGDGTGAFVPRGAWPTTERPVQPLTADLDQDGGLDLAVPAREGEGRITLYFNDPAVAGAPELPSIAGVVLTITPNPSRGAVRLAWENAEGRDANGRLCIVDAAGRRVRALAWESTGPRGLAATWDGRDAQGRSAPPGTYFIRSEGREGDALRILRLR